MPTVFGALLWAPHAAAHLFPEDGSAQILSTWDIQLYLPSEAQSPPFPAGTLEASE